MAEYFSPGVYVEEYDNSPRTMDGVGTSTAGFVGLATKGPSVGAPQLVTNYASFVRQYGEGLSEFAFGEFRYLAAAVEQFFANGGTRCYVARVIPSDAKKATAKKGILTVTAKNEGKWGDRIQVTLDTVAKRKLQVVGKTGDAFVAKSVEGFREGDIVVCAGEYNKVKTIFDNTITFEKAFKANIVDTAIVPKTVINLVEINMSVRYGQDVETYNGLSLNTASPAFVGYKLANSELVDITIEPFTGVSNPVAAMLGEKNESGMFTLEGGSDGTKGKVNAGTFIGEDNGPGRRTGLASFVENNSIAMLAIPGITIPEVVVSLVGHCETLKSRFAVIDMPKEAYKTTDLIAYRDMIDSTYAAMYHPWLQVFDRTTGQSDFVPPSGAVMGVYSRTDTNRGVHKAPANETVFATGLSVNYTKDEQDILNPAGINLIRQLPGQGIRIWGARTASSNTAFRYVNVRRLFIFVEETIKASTNWVVFEPNDGNLWSRVNLTVTNFLDGLWRSGMLAGNSASEAFFVEIGPSTMSRDDINAGRLICNVGIAPSKPAEFVIFKVTQNTADAAQGSEE